MKRNNKALEAALAKKIKEDEYTGVAVCIRGPEGVLFEKGFGLRNVEKNLPATPDTVFGIASLSKSFTALACCILAAEGKMSLDDPASKYLPNLHIPGVPDELVSVRQLGLHRAGLPPMETLEWSIVMNTPGRLSKEDKRLVKEAPNKMETIDQIIDYINEGLYPALGEPGEYMSYSNEGYALLSYIVDEASGSTLEQFLMDRIFEPLGMSRSVLDLDASEIKKMVGAENVTLLHQKNSKGKVIEDDNWSILPPFRGCACVKSTAQDLTKYYQMLANGGVFEGKRIIPEKACELMFGPEYPLRRKPFNVMGLRKLLIDGKMVCEHGGALHGVSARGGFVEGGYSAVVLSNDSNKSTEALHWMCYNYIFGNELDKDLNWCQPDGDAFSRPEMIVGDYVGHEGIVSHNLVYQRDGKLMLRSGEDVYELQHCEATVFAVINPKTGKRVDTYRFFIRDGMAWACKCGSRIFRRA